MRNGEYGERVTRWEGPTGEEIVRKEEKHEKRRRGRGRKPNVPEAQCKDLGCNLYLFLEARTHLL